MVCRLAATEQLSGHPAVSVAGEFLNDDLNLKNEIIVVTGRLLRLVVVILLRQINDYVQINNLIKNNAI